MQNGSAQQDFGIGGERVLVVGLGGIGGILAASLSEQGIEVSAVTTNGLVREALGRDGYVLTADGEARRIPAGEICERAPDRPGGFDFILLATQPPSVARAAQEALNALAPGGAVVCFQNGLCEERVGAIVGPERVLGAVVAWGASMIGPGQYERTSAGGFTIGRLVGRPDIQLDRLARLLECIGPVERSANLRGARWSKLAINCAISSLGTIGGDRLGTLLKHRYVRRLALEIMTEVVDVGIKEGVTFERVAGTLDLNWIALSPDERNGPGSAGLVAKHALLLAVGARYRRMRSSMLSAIERGREPAVDFLNGEITRRAAQHGLNVPVNERMQSAVHAIALGRLKPSIELLRDIFDETRSSVATLA